MNPMDKWLEDAKKQAKQKRLFERQSRPKGQKCSNCINHQGHQYSPKYHYCKLGSSPHTGNGFAKTKASEWCARWEAKP